MGWTGKYGIIRIGRIIMSKRKFEEKKERYRKFIIVREPMERLASCYNDKMIVNPARSLFDWRKRVKNKAPLVIDGDKQFCLIMHYIKQQLDNM